MFPMVYVSSKRPQVLVRKLTFGLSVRPVQARAWEGTGSWWTVPVREGSPTP